MKLRLLLAACLFLAFLSPSALASEPAWVLEGKSIWSRDAGAATLNADNGIYHIEHNGEKDWAVTLCNSIPVRPGETFRISGTMQVEGAGRVALTVGLFDPDKKIIDWQHGNASQQGNCEKKRFSDEFVIPRGAPTILPRIVGQGTAKAVVSDIKLEKLDTIALLDPELTVPTDGERKLELIPTEKGFADKLEFKGNFSSNRGQTPSASVDRGQTFENQPTWRIAARDGLAFDLSPLEPLKVVAGERYLVALRINLERGKPRMEIRPWEGGVVGKSSIASGTFRPDVGEEGGKWCCIHAYVTVPEKCEGMLPVVSCPDGGVFNVAHWTISRPDDAELNPVRKKVEGYAAREAERREEAFDRGLVAQRSEQGVYLSWRLLRTDEPETGFDVYRYAPDGKETKLNEKPITETTDFLDTTAPAADTADSSEFRWSVRGNMDTQRTRILPVAYESERVAAVDQPYTAIKLKDADSFSHIAFADLDGDGRLDYVVKTPNAGIDPYYMYWRKSPGTYKLQAYDADGRFLWEYDLGWGIEQGIWYSPYLVADLDGDGCAEIAVKTCPGDFRDINGRIYDGPEHLTILDGRTGKERMHVDWPEREGLPYNLSSRHQLAVAYLDGKTPSLIALRGTYSRMTAVAYQLRPGADKLEELWRWDNRWERERGRWGQGAHTTHAFDLDGDGRDEILLGSIALDDDGSILWELKLGHPDHMYLGDIDPERPGLEIVYGIETRQRERNGVCMVDAKTGEILWGHDKPTAHIHSTGLVSDIDARFPGCEIWSGEQDSVKDRWLRDAKGNILELPKDFPVRDLAPKSVWWAAELQRQLLRGGRPLHFPSLEPVGKDRFEGTVVAIADILGDWREEVVTSHKADGAGEIRIYTTSIPARDRRTTFLQDRNYRATMIESTMGYRQIPLPIAPLKSGKE